jgi:hypothetical protein
VQQLVKEGAMDGALFHSTENPHIIQFWLVTSSKSFEQQDHGKKKKKQFLIPLCI